MKATVIRPFKGCRDGERKVRRFKPGEEIEGDLARAMIADGKAKSAAPNNRALRGAPEDRFRDSADVEGRDGRDSGERSKPDAGTGKRRGRKPRKTSGDE